MRRFAAQFTLGLIGFFTVAQTAVFGRELERDRDIVNVVPLDGELLAVDVRSGFQQTMGLHVEEAVLGTDARGEIGLARTSQRLLGFSAGAGWAEFSYGREERTQPPAVSYVARGAALVPLTRRLAAFTAASRRWFQCSLSRDEPLLGVRGSGDLLVAVTSRRVLAVDPGLGTFVDFSLDGDEQPLDSASADGAITIVTNRRVLSYTSGSSAWVARSRTRG